MSEPLFHVKRGHPTPEELAALTAVLAAKLWAATAAVEYSTDGARSHIVHYLPRGMTP